MGQNIIKTALHIAVAVSAVLWPVGSHSQGGYVEGLDEAPASASIPTDAEFRAYPAAVYGGRVVLPNFARASRAHREFRTAWTDDARRGVNFAGHFAVGEVCMTGWGCAFHILMDLRTGALLDFPRVAGEDIYVAHRADSALMRVSWTMPDIRGGRRPSQAFCVYQDLVYSPGGFRRLPERRLPGQCPYLRG